jgi:hypothetical protein
MVMFGLMNVLSPLIAPPRQPDERETVARQIVEMVYQKRIASAIAFRFFLGGGQLWLRGVHMPLASTGKSACSRARPEQMRIDMENVVPA